MTGASHPLVVPGLEINEVADGYVVHQPALGRVHYLNHTAAVVMEMCNGRNSEAELVRLLQLAYGLGAPPVDDVETCLAGLRAQGLIT